LLSTLSVTMKQQQYTYIWLYKPYQVMSQFSKEGSKSTLADYLKNIPKNVYPVGRLDFDSEGLLLLTNDKHIAHQLLHPDYQHQRTYYVQVEGAITADALARLSKGVDININGKIHRTLATKVLEIREPILPERMPPIRFRQNIPTSWISITLVEGKNRQIRRMTAAVGFPTLRLVRYSIGAYNIDTLQPGQYIERDRLDTHKLLIKTKVCQKNATRL
jgi:23S rRNA pseudouridine2457 synthase